MGGAWDLRVWTDHWKLMGMGCNSGWGMWGGVCGVGTVGWGLRGGD